MKVAVVTCFFGAQFHVRKQGLGRVHPAPEGYDAYFFTNNPKLKKKIIKNGWQYLYVDYPISEKYELSSFQSKKIKFLQFLKDEKFDYFKAYDSIFYADHKELLTQNFINDIINLKPLSKKILLRQTKTPKLSVWTEHTESLLQPRYKMYEKEVTSWIEGKIKEGYEEDCRVCNTGLILWDGVHDNKSPLRARKLADEVYQALSQTGTSECQIIWCILAQKYREIICEIPSRRVHRGFNE